ncbi:MAG: hypothetical protein AMXMBFR33_63660 [Candidatus Xenobia bacterium]
MGRNIFPMRLLLALLLLTLPASGQGFTVDSQPFPGLVQGARDAMKVELRPLMLALGLSGHRAYGGWCLTRGAEQDCAVKQLLGPGRVYLEGQNVRADTDSQGRTMVNLADVTRILGLKLESRNGATELTTGHKPGYVGLPVEPNRASPGAEIDLASALSPARTNVVVFYIDWCPACWKVIPSLEQLVREHPELSLVEVNVVDWDQPAARQFQVRSTPTVVVYDGQGQVLHRDDAALDWLEQGYGWKAPTRIKCTGTPGTP